MYIKKPTAPSAVPQEQSDASSVKDKAIGKRMCPECCVLKAIPYQIEKTNVKAVNNMTYMSGMPNARQTKRQHDDGSAITSVSQTDQPGPGTRIPWSNDHSNLV